MRTSKVLGEVEAHEEQGDLPAVECQPVDIRPGHLLPLHDRQRQGEGGVVVGGSGGDGLGQVGGVGILGLPTLQQLVNDHSVVVHTDRRLRANDPVSARTFSSKFKTKC